MKRSERREMDRRWRKEQSRVVPSSSSVFRYLAAFHDADQEKLRIEGKAFIPAPNEHLRGLVYEQLRVLKEVLALLPAGVEKVRLRSDTAGYQQHAC